MFELVKNTTSNLVIKEVFNRLESTDHIILDSTDRQIKNGTYVLKLRGKGYWVSLTDIKYSNTSMVALKVKHIDWTGFKFRTYISLIPTTNNKSIDYLFEKYLNKDSMIKRFKNIENHRKVNKALNNITKQIRQNIDLYKYSNIDQIEEYCENNINEYSQFVFDIKTIDRLASDRIISSLLGFFLQYSPQCIVNICCVLTLCGLNRTPKQIIKAFPISECYPSDKEIKCNLLKYIALLEV